MSNIKKQLDNQQKLNKATEEIFNYFNTVADFSSHYVTMAKAQTTIITLMNLHQHSLFNSGDHEQVFAEDITNFLWEVNEVYNLLKPFADMLGQIYGNKD